ncbi:MAG: hypothetical protein U1A27_00165 [Phycisphaerae bacterium]
MSRHGRATSETGAASPRRHWPSRIRRLCATLAALDRWIEAAREEQRHARNAVMDAIERDGGPNEAVLARQSWARIEVAELLRERRALNRKLAAARREVGLPE